MTVYIFPCGVPSLLSPMTVYIFTCGVLSPLSPMTVYIFPCGVPLPPLLIDCVNNYLWYPQAH